MLKFHKIYKNKFGKLKIVLKSEGFIITALDKYIYYINIIQIYYKVYNIIIRIKLNLKKP